MAENTANRLHGNTTPTLTLQVGASSAVDLGTYVANFEIADGDGQNTTNSDWQNGKAPKALNVTFVLNQETNGPVDYFNKNKGATVAVVWIPNGGAATSPTNKKLTATGTMPYGIPNFAVGQGSPTDDITFDVTVQCGSTPALADS